MPPRSRESGDDPFARIAPYYDQIMSSVPYGIWAEYLAQLAELAGRPIRPGSRVLDLATGTGSIALQLARRGCLVVGIDRSEAMLARARHRAADSGLPVEFLCCDLTDFDLPPEFDHALCVYDSLNYILDHERLKRAFANTRAALRAGGLLIFDVNTVRALEMELFTQRSAEDAPVRYRWTSRYNPRTRISRIRMRFEVAATGEHLSVVHHQRAYTDEELRSALAAAGFDDVAAYAAYRLAPPDDLTDRAFYVARPAQQ